MRIQNSVIGRNLETAVGAAASAGIQAQNKAVQSFTHNQSPVSPTEGIAAKRLVAQNANVAALKTGNDTYDRLTPEEKSFVWRHPIVSFGFNKDAKKALGEAQNRFPQSELHNGRGDAFRHAYWNALMTKRHGSDLAKEFADAHETNPNQPADEKAMDLHNNEVGRRIARENPNATDEELANLIMQALERGELRTLK